MIQRAAQADNLQHATPVALSAEDAADFWTEVHERVQQQLEVLETEVRRTASGVRVEQGRTHGKEFYLFSYRAFSLPHSDRERVVSGFTFAPTDEGVRIEADISREESGDVIFSAPSKTVAKRREEILAAAEDSARKLCQSAVPLAAALAAE